MTTSAKIYYLPSTKMIPIDHAHKFVDFLAANGIVGDVNISRLVSGAVVRFHVEGDRIGSRNGYAQAFIGRAGPYFKGGSFRIHGEGNWLFWRPGGSAQALTQEQRVEMTAQAIRQKEREKFERANREEQARIHATNLWNLAGRGYKFSPYLGAKKYKPETLNDLDLRLTGNCLLVPMRTVTGDLWSLQRIYPDPADLGNFAKRFLAGGKLTGLVWFTHSFSGAGDAILCESVSTALACSQIFGIPSASSFGADRLPSAAVILATHFQRKLYIAADDDAHLGAKNKGLSRAIEAAKAINAEILLPRKQDKFYHERQPAVSKKHRFR